MSDGGGGTNPFGYVLIPVIGFGLIASLITCYRYRRKKRRLARMVADPAYAARQLEAGRGGGGGGADNVILFTTGEGGRRTGGGSRSRRLGLGAGLGSREEGLNELGEAPPAYMPSAPKPPSDGGVGVGDVELMTYSQATAAVGTSRSPPLYGDELPTTTTTTTGTATNEGTTGATTGNTTTTAAAVAAAVVTPGESPPVYDEPPRAGTRTDGETREDTGNATTTTTTTITALTAAAAADTISTPLATDEPVPPPRAVLPSS